MLHARHEGIKGEWRFTSTHSEPRHRTEVSGQLQKPAFLLDRKILRYPLNRRLGGIQGYSSSYGKDVNLLTLRGIESRIAEPVAQSLYRLLHPGC